MPTPQPLGPVWIAMAATDLRNVVQLPLEETIDFLQNIITHLSKSLGESMLSRIRAEGLEMYGRATKAGTFIDSEGQVRIAGEDDASDDNTGFNI